MSSNPLVKALGAGTVMQVVMILIGQFVPQLREGMLYPVAGTMIGLVTGWLPANQAAPMYMVWAALDEGARRAEKERPAMAADITGDGHAEDAGFRRTVVYLTDGAKHTCRRGDVDDAAVPALDHAADHGLQAVETSREMDVEHLLPLV